MSPARVLRPFDIAELPPVGATTLLEASAGTGKTWTIAALVARYVAEGHARLEDMLVVTFGRAASQELRERVRERLVEVDRVLGGLREPHPEDRLLSLLLAADEAEVARRRRRVREALGSFDSATIATTHQFCQLVLKSLGVAGDTDARARLVEDLDDLVDEVVDDLYLRGFGYDDQQPAFDLAAARQVARAAIGDPQARLEPLDAAPGSAAERRRRFAQAVRDEVDVRKRRQGILSYDDLLSQLAGALQAADAPARDRMRRRWQIVLVDEFQDTDPVQWQVLDRAFSGHATMVLIGDPKQAIYAFRGGDVVTYLAAAETAAHHATLNVNHRSDEGLLRGVQTLLGGAALGDAHIVVRPVESAHTKASRLVGAPHPEPFRLRWVSREQLAARPSAGVPIARLREHVARDLALDVRALLAARPAFDGRPLEPRDVAVLCETRKQCQLAWSALVGQGIPAVVAGGGSVFDTDGARAWATLLEAMEQTHRSGRVRAAALTPFFGCTPEQLDAEGGALTDRTADTLRDWSELFADRGIAAVAEAAAAAGLAARVLARADGERLMTDLRHTAESLHDVATRDRMGLVALLGWMRSQMAERKADVAGERTRRLDSDAAAVQILTIHGSKGLEFPVVYLPGLSDAFPRTPAVPLFHDVAGHRCIDVAGPDAARAHVLAAVAEDSGEDLRLLYVAMTRAQAQLITWWIPSARNTTSSPLHRMLFGRAVGDEQVLDAPGLPSDREAAETFGRWFDAGGPCIESATWWLAPVPELARDRTKLAVRRFARWIDQSWRRTSYSGLSAAAESALPQAGAVLPPASEPEDPPRDDEPEIGIGFAAVSDGMPSPMAGLPVGATFGSLVHAVLEHADPAAPEHGGNLAAELLHHVEEQLVRWPVELDPEELAGALVSVYDSPLGPLAPTTLRALGRRDRMCELDFELPLAGGDVRDYVATSATLRDLAGLLREHLPPGDPLLRFASTVDQAAYAAQDLRGYLTGSVDVVLRVDGRYLIVDYKTNWLGPQDEPLTAEAYRPQRLAEAMNHSSYPLQALLYAVVLHRFLRWRVPDYDPRHHFGGVLYLYLRGMCGPQTPVVEGHPCGVFSWQPPVALVEAVSDLLDGVAPELSR